jgi:PGF-pre-PGF domain-containing protein
MWWILNIGKNLSKKSIKSSRLMCLFVTNIFLISILSLIFVGSVSGDDGSLALDVDFLKGSYDTQKETTPIDSGSTNEETVESEPDEKSPTKSTSFDKTKTTDTTSFEDSSNSNNDIDKNTSNHISTDNKTTDLVNEDFYVEDIKTVEKQIGDVLLGDKIIVETEKSNHMSIKKVEFSTSNDFNNVTFSIKKLDEKPIDIPEKPLEDCLSYVYLDIKLTSNDVYMHENEFEFLKFHFKINKSWINENNIDLDSVKLYRFNNDWQQLFTILIDEDDLYFYFEAESPGLSIYTVVGTEIVEGSPDIIINNTFIPLNAWIAIIGIVIIVMITMVYKLKFIYKED